MSADPDQEVDQKTNVQQTKWGHKNENFAHFSTFELTERTVSVHVPIKLV